MSEPKILVWDIETKPHKVWTFSTRKAFIGMDQIIEPTRMICWAAKWLGEPRVYFRSEYHNSREDMIQKLHELLNEADVSVTYNGDNFDLKHARREFHLAKLGQPSPFVSVDLYKVARKNETWASHKMDFIAEQLGLSQKLRHHGFILWREAMGDFGEERQRKAWNLMRRYNKQDLKPTEELFYEYLPVITNLPSAGLFLPELHDEDDLLLPCPNPLCPESGRVIRQGYKRTKTRRYRQFQCQACGRWFSNTRSELGVTTA